MNERNTKIYDDRLEFEEGFFTINKKEIRFKDITEVNLRKGIIQQTYGLGTIYLATAATSSSRPNPFSILGLGSSSGSGITIPDIQNSDEAYEKIKQLVGLKR